MSQNYFMAPEGLNNKVQIHFQDVQGPPPPDSC